MDENASAGRKQRRLESRDWEQIVAIINRVIQGCWANQKVHERIWRTRICNQQQRLGQK